MCLDGLCIVDAVLCHEQAAVRAASRTAEFATTGDWPEEEEAMYPTSPIDRSLSASASVRIRSESPVIHSTEGL